MIKLGQSDLDVFPLCLGGNVFGWSADERASFAVLDAYAEAGGNFIDTADIYSAWAPGNRGGESEEILGRWVAARKNRDRVVIATKCGRAPWAIGLSQNAIRTAVEGSLRRLATDRIDLYYAHRDDPGVPLEETLCGFDALVREGKVRYVAASNYSAPRLAESLAIAKREGLVRFVALQPHYNLLERRRYEGDLEALCAREGLACLPYYALASGFLTGKYRPGAKVESVRGEGASKYMNEGGGRVLTALDAISAAHQTTVAAVSLAWLASRPTVAAPIASARTPEQLADLLPMTSLRLTPDDIERLDTATT